MSSSQQTNLPLPQYYAKTLQSLLPIFDDSLPLSEPSTQAQLAKATDDLYLISRMLTSLGVFSDNEGLDELGDRELVFMTVPWVLGEAEAKGGLGGYPDRIAALRRSDTAFNAFLGLLQTYNVFGSDEQAEGSSSTAPGAVPSDPGQRREAKIRAYRREKELKERISAALPDHPEPSSSPLTFVLSLLPNETGASSTSVNEEEPDLRNACIQVLQLLHSLTTTTLGNTAMELSILSQAPSEPTSGPIEDPRTRRQETEDAQWRLDRTPGSYKPKELISGGGKVLRPFTILPSTTALSDRERLRSEVFRASHRLPTMTIDEYLAEEDAMGNIIRGGGQASYDAPTESELLELEAENDGTAAGAEAAEKRRAKTENWAQYTDDNKKGAGNTMNRG
ncbi:uncharacterized protein EHS24_003304 [Apiotrichum porosum]|uniref:TAP42-like protein n=1 Tax=Apiotrichum porosum TaxID=105984 RepID=A0A427XEQ9_9TREE|nr:uncharacterized protein EHS24_003304 [Apiotrichum porosum]RSH77345.1 hypothetical protein EHS24_003304 [Apiotrichum porosum]